MYEDEDFGEQRDYKSERDTLIDDIAVLKSENEELKDIEKLLNQSRYKQSKTIEQLKQENEKLRSRLDEFLEHDYDNQKLYKENRNLLSEISQHIGNKPSSSTYKYFRAKLDGIGIKVNKNIEEPMDFIKRIAKEGE